MATDSSSGTFPSSSRLTIDSSSSIARSNGRLERSGLSAMMIPVQPLSLIASRAGTSEQGNSALHQRAHMGGDRVGQADKIVTAFQHGNDASARGLLSHFHELARRPLEIAFEQIEIGKRVAHMRVEPRRDHQEIGPEVPQARQ